MPGVTRHLAARDGVKAKGLQEQSELVEKTARGDYCFVGHRIKCRVTVVTIIINAKYVWESLFKQ